jgi:hypothetical protein
MMFEFAFFTMWANNWTRSFGRTHEARRTLKTREELRGLPEIAQALFIERGGFAEAVIRMLIPMADNRSSVRRDRLGRASRVLTQDEPLSQGVHRLPGQKGSCCPPRHPWRAAAAVVCPDEEKSLGGAILAARESTITPILVGDPAPRAACASGGASPMSA